MERGMIMVKKAILSFLLSFGLIFPAFADSLGSAVGGTAGNQSNMAGGIYNSSAPTLTAGQQVGLQVDANGDLKVVTSGTPSGTQDVNIVQTGGVTQLRGAGAVGTGSERVAVGQDTTTIAGSAPGTTAAPSTSIVSVVHQPSAASTSGVSSVQSASVETGHVIKAAAGNLYDFNVSADSTLSAVAWAVMIFNSTTVPAAGAVTPVKCYLAPIGSTSISGAFPTPLYLGTGISMAVSTGQTCFTKTDSAHGFISANAQ